VEWAHAIAPGAHILLVEAASNSYANLFQAVDYARNYPGVSVVSMSWAAANSPARRPNDFHMTTPAAIPASPSLPRRETKARSSLYPAISPTFWPSEALRSRFPAPEITSAKAAGVAPAAASALMNPSPPTKAPSLKAARNAPVRISPTMPTRIPASMSIGPAAGTPSAAPVSALPNGRRWWPLPIRAEPTTRIKSCKVRWMADRNSCPPSTTSRPAIFHDETSGRTGEAICPYCDCRYDLVTGRGSPRAQLVVQHLLTANSSGDITPAPLDRWRRPCGHHRGGSGSCRAAVLTDAHTETPMDGGDLPVVHGADTSPQSSNGLMLNSGAPLFVSAASESQINVASAAQSQRQISITSYMRQAVSGGALQR